MTLLAEGKSAISEWVPVDGRLFPEFSTYINELRMGKCVRGPSQDRRKANITEYCGVGGAKLGCLSPVFWLSKNDTGVHIMMVN